MGRIRPGMSAVNGCSRSCPSAADRSRETGGSRLFLSLRSPLTTAVSALIVCLLPALQANAGLLEIFARGLKSIEDIDSNPK